MEFGEADFTRENCRETTKPRKQLPFELRSSDAATFPGCKLNNERARGHKCGPGRWPTD